MLTLTMSHNFHTRSPFPPRPLPLYPSDPVGVFICKAQHYCRKSCIYIQFVILAIGITFSCLTTIV